MFRQGLLRIRIKTKHPPGGNFNFQTMHGQVSFGFETVANSFFFYLMLFQQIYNKLEGSLCYSFCIYEIWCATLPIAPPRFASCIVCRLIKYCAPSKLPIASPLNAFRNSPRIASLIPPVMFPVLLSVLLPI